MFEKINSVIRNYSHRNRAKSVLFVGTMILLAYFLGKGPTKIERFYTEPIETPKVRTIGYDQKEFSRLEIIADENRSVFTPSTAVRKWNGVNYEEKSKEITDIYALSQDDKIVLYLTFPFRPEFFTINGVRHDSSDMYSYNSRNGSAGVKYNSEFIDLDNIPNSGSLEIFVYYAKDKEKSKDVELHQQKAERYFIRLLR